MLEFSFTFRPKTEHLRAMQSESYKRIDTFLSCFFISITAAMRSIFILF